MGEVLRIPLPRTPVNKGSKAKGRGVMDPALVDTATLLRTQGCSDAPFGFAVLPARTRGHSSCLGYKRHLRSPQLRCLPCVARRARPASPPQSTLDLEPKRC